MSYLVRESLGDAVERGFTLSIVEKARELRFQAEAVPLPEGWGQREAMLAEADELEHELREFQARVTQARALADPRWQQAETEQADLRRRRNSDEPMRFSDLAKLETINLEKHIESPSELLELSRVPDLHQKLVGFIAELQTRNWLTAREAAQLGAPFALSPARQAALKKESDDHQKLVNEWQDILKGISNPFDKRQALTIFNQNETPFSRQKLDDVKARLRAAKLIPPQSLAGRIVQHVKGE